MHKLLAITGASVILSVVLVAGAAAQGYVIQSPRGLTFVNPTPNGGYVIQSPGQGLTYANPTPNGGYVIQSPGQGLTFVNPSPNINAGTLCIRDHYGRCY